MPLALERRGKRTTRLLLVREVRLARLYEAFEERRSKRIDRIEKCRESVRVRAEVLGAETTERRRNEHDRFGCDAFPRDFLPVHESLSLVRRIDEPGKTLHDLGVKRGEAPRVQGVRIIEGAPSSARPVRAPAPRRRSDHAGREKDESEKTALPTGAGRSQLHCECLRAFFDFDNLVRNEIVSFPVD
jgi:hypothetical protein